MKTERESALEKMLEESLSIHLTWLYLSEGFTRTAEDNCEALDSLTANTRKFRNSCVEELAVDVAAPKAQV